MKGQLLLLACLILSIVIANLANLEVVRNGGWIGLDRVVQNAEKSVACVIASTVFLVWLVFFTNFVPFPLDTIVLKISMVVIVMGALLLFCWNSIEALWQYWQQTGHF